MKNSLKVVITFFALTLFVSIIWLKYFQPDVGWGDNVFLFERTIFFIITIILLFFYGYFSKLKFDKSFLISQVIITGKLLFCFFVGVMNFEYYNTIIYQSTPSTPDYLKFVSDNVFQICNLIIEPFSVFLWKSAEGIDKNYVVLLTSIVPSLSIITGIYKRINLNN